MLSYCRLFPTLRGATRGVSIAPVLWGAVSLLLVGLVSSPAQAKKSRTKHTIGASAILTEKNTGIPFSARIDTGAASCSIHAEEIEISGEATPPNKYKGKTIRFKIQNEKGKSEWIESKIDGVVRVKSSALKDGNYDRRYKVRLTLQWKDFEKEVRVTLNDRDSMEFPLLIGRNYLNGDFVVDVALEDEADVALKGAEEKDKDSEEVGE